MTTNAGSPAGDIASLLITEGYGKTSPDIPGDLPIYTVGYEPDYEGVLVTFYDTPSPAANPAWGRDRPFIQIRVKGVQYGYQEAYKTQQTIKETLLGRPPQMINNVRYVGFWMQSDIATLGLDRDNRPILVANYRLVRDYETEHRKIIT